MSSITGLQGSASAAIAAIQQSNAQVQPELMQEVKLYTTAKERELYDNMADLFAIIQTLNYLEKAYVRDSISPSEYTPACEKLIAQFRTAKSMLKDQVPSIEKFMGDYKLSCPAAYQRLQIGVPATVEHGGTGESTSARNAAVHVAETVQSFITLMDSIKLQMSAVDELHPQLNDLLGSMNKLPSLSADWEGKVNLREWLAKMNAMQASDELTPEQLRQLLFDLEKHHNAFYRSLAS
ncbi:vacuolar protein sorting-associated protein 28 [Capsaspora owczarzaki ATCC 30864]|uniref:Vacuolar protein sorting-associated protein 28 homolog n=1 Tax=Capsaspora owczarzaki (strain ATCC 30864) TaxID=595528 RepID=A0A0D2VM95_CAPO3|nr:vacuolar protein sorting-associated protein 28 [Capsaspora owczarzaki ATCC 30864]KJE91267.1 vacuolar protein sorting-associated protein 28 [Capsaspora owczarzaki ATCC 30864]|eukprot:XP_004349177.1 vacuolar protein sorting-associated protein 28 [Capsaspora owczarzaki ATCC 30864]